MRKTISIITCSFLTAALQAGTLHIYVSPQGNDNNKGTSSAPVCTFAQAQKLARQAKAEDNVCVTFDDGIYYLPDSITFTAADSRKKVVYRAKHEGKAILSGGVQLQLKWRDYQDGILVANVEGNPDIDQLWVNGKRQRMARFPNAEEGHNVFDTWNLRDAKYDAEKDPLAPERIARWSKPEGGFIHAMHTHLWGDMHWQITGKNADGTLIYHGGWQNNRPAPMHGIFRMVENIFEELDAPGEWYYDRDSHQLYFKPLAQMNMQEAKVEIVRLRNLITFQGTMDKPVRNIQLSGFTFRHTARTFMLPYEPLLRSDWAISRTAAVLLRYAEGCSITDCEFDQVGGNTILASGYNRHLVFRGCYIHGSGASGVMFVGLPSAVRNPLFGYKGTDYDSISYEPGPCGNEYPDSCSVEDCLITLTGRDEKQTAGVQISMAHAIRVSHCSIYNVPRAGINIGEGAFGGHVVEHSDIFNTVLETGDHGSFNSWGRDRFWHDDTQVTIPHTQNNRKLPLLDMLHPNELYHNRWRCDYGWDIDLDDGSSWYLIHDNLCLKGGLKMREGYYRKAWNNILVGNSLNPHVWYSNSEDEFFSNIVYSAYRPALMNATIPNNGKWGKRVDSNLFACPDHQRKAFLHNECDRYSLSADPQFVDAEHGDFHVGKHSPALKIGFHNFRMDDFGVQKKQLRRIAETPEIPIVGIHIGKEEGEKTAEGEWMGATLHNPEPQDLSAYGIGFDEGGVVLLSVPHGSEAAKVGFREGDLLQRIDDERIRCIADLQKWTKKQDSATRKHKVSLVRGVKRTTLTY